MTPTIWNSIPGHLHLITSRKGFNTKCKHFFSTAIRNFYRTQYRETVLTNCQLNFYLPSFNFSTESVCCYYILFKLVFTKSVDSDFRAF